MSDYTYRCIDLTTGVVLNDLPFEVPELPRVIGGDSEETFTLPLYEADIKALRPKESTTPGRTSIFALRDGWPVWGGIIWSRSYSRSTRVMSLSVSTIESYFRHRVFNQRMTISNRDQIFIMIWLMSGVWPLAGYTNLDERKLNWALGPNYDSFTSLSIDGSMWIVDYDGTRIPVADNLAVLRTPYRPDADVDGQWIATAPAVSGVLRDRTYDAGKNVYDALQELMNVERGLEWTLEPTIADDGQICVKPRFGDPSNMRLGRTVDKTSFTWIASMPRDPASEETEEHPDTPADNVEDYTYTEDAKQAANHVVATGAEVNGVVLIGDRGNLQPIRGGYPTLEASTSYSDIIYQATLDSHALGDLQDRPLPAKYSEWTVSSVMEPEFGAYTLGDEGFFGASDDLDEPQENGLPGRVSVERIIGWSLIPDSTSQREKVKLITNPTSQAGSRLPPKLGKRFESWDRQIKGLSIVSRAQQSNVAVSMTQTAPVTLPASGTAGTPGPETVIGGFYFQKQADFLHAMFVITAGTSGVDWYFYDIVSGEKLTNYVNSVYRGTSNSNNSIWDVRFPLAGWSFGQTVEIEFRGVATNGLTTRTMRTYAAYQGPK